MEKEIEDFARNRDEAPSCGFGFFAVCAAMALLESFAFSFHLPSLREGDFDFAQILYLGVREDGLLLLVLSAVFFGGWVLARRLNVPLAVNRNKTIAALSVVFAIVIVVGRAFSVDDIGVGSYGTFETIAASKGRILLSAIMLVGLILLFYNALGLLFHALDRVCRSLSMRNAIGKNGEEVGGREFAAIRRSRADRMRLFVLRLSVPRMMAILVVCWLPYLVGYFPGCVYHDSAYQLQQFFGASSLSAHHPLVTTYLYGMLVSVGRFFGSDALGVFLCMLFQAAALSYACARLVSSARLTTNRTSCLAVLIPLLIFAFVPLWGTAVAAIKKDALFCACFVLMFVQGIELLLAMKASSRMDAPMFGRKLALFSLFGVGASLIRNDGYLFFAVAAICFLTAALLLSTERKRLIFRFALSFLAVSLCYFVGYRTVVMDAVGAEEGSVVEALTIPIQQTARFYIEAPEDVTPEIEEGVSRVLDTEGLTREIYNPLVSDNIKFSYAREGISSEDLVAFAKSYILMGIEHPQTFAEAFIDQTLGWWYPELVGKPDWSVGGMGLYQNSPKVELYSQVIDVDMPFYDSTFVQALNQAIGCFGYIPGIGLLVYPAIYFWALLIGAAYLWTRDRKREILLLVPLFFFFAICVASPVNGLTRYAMPIIMCMPLMFAWIVGEPLSGACEAPRNVCRKGSTTDSL